MIRALTLGLFLLLIARIYLVANPPKEVPSPDKPVTIEVSVWGMPFENALYTDVYIPEFERQNPGIKVRFCHFEDYGNRILLSHAGGIAPDVVRQGMDGGMAWIDRGLNRPLDAYIDGPDGIDRNDFIPTLWTGLMSGGKTYGVPQDINIQGLYYNRDLFDKAGLKYPDETWTWKDLKEAADRLTEDKDKDGHPEVVGLDLSWNAGGFLPFMLQNGGHLWEKDRMTPAFNTPETAEALKFYKSLMRTYSLTRSDSQRGGLGPDKFFEQGRIAMYIDGSWRTPALQQHAAKLNFGVAPLPMNKKAMSVSGSCYWAISRDSKHPDVAWKLVKYLSSQEALTKYWQMLWVAPPARWSSLRSTEFQKVTGSPGKIPGIRDAKEFEVKCGWIPKVLEKGWTTTETWGPYGSELFLHFGQAVDKVMLQNADPATVLKEADRLVREEIAKAREVQGKR
ncbi:MAG: ABC transporter substrate-binding protein [Fimbriimonas sp.]